MRKLVRAMLWDLFTREGRYLLIASLVRSLPGQVGMEIRRIVFGRYFKKVGEGLAVYEGARIYGPDHLSVGRNCRIGLDNVIQANGEVEMGDDVLLGPGVKIWSVNHVSARLDIPIWDQGYEHKKVTIGNGVWLGADVFVMPGANIGDHVVVAAGSVVGAKDVEPGTVLAGNPARRIGSRYERAMRSDSEGPARVSPATEPSQKV